MISKILGKTPNIFDEEPHENQNCQTIKNQWKKECLNIRYKEQPLAKQQICKFLFEDFMDCSIDHYTKELKKLE